MGDKMKTLYLLRHAKSSWGDSELSDFDRPLNNRGLKEAREIAEHMAENEYIPELILCSTAKRTRKTLEEILKALKFEGEANYLESLYLASSNTIGEAIKSVNVESLLVIGHNPGIENFLNEIINEDLIMKTSQLAVIDMESRKLVDYIRPKDF
ncbi:MAG: histidine phosphatase family protein [Tissierellia bacterium]|nr:histidine phosphatase family protein [Tissierellia bacterium]